MNLPKLLLVIFFINAATLANAQHFDVIKDTADYTLKEVDSAYYFSHGAEMYSEFRIDSSVIKAKNGIVHLPLSNGAYIEFGDTSTLEKVATILMCNYEGENDRLDCYLVSEAYYNGDYKSYLVNRKSGKVDTIDNVPSFAPQSMVYVSNFLDRAQHVAGIIVYNHQTNKSIKIPLFDHLEQGYNANFPYYYRWISNEVFMVHTLPQFASKPDDRRVKYFLVEIKSE